MASREANARFIVESVEILHRQGFGRLKLASYASSFMYWRHWLFASDSFPDPSSNDLEDDYWQTYTLKRIWGASEAEPIACGESASEIAEILLRKHPEFFDTAKGSDPIYEKWYREVLIAHPVGLLHMEFSNSASIRGKPIKTPYNEAKT